jgi:hypothetical protein
MSVVIGDLRIDCGEVYDGLTNGTTAATGLLSKAYAMVKLATGTTTGHDMAVRSLADAYVCQQVLGSSNSTDFSVSVIRVGRTQILEMRKAFLEEAKNALAIDGYSFSPAALYMEVVNQ